MKLTWVYQSNVNEFIYYSFQGDISLYISNHNLKKFKKYNYYQII